MNKDKENQIQHEYDEKLKKMNEFLLNINCLDKITPYSNKENIFKILKTQDAEIRHSNFLAWLLDVNESHKLGDKFISSVISKVIKENRNMFPDITKWTLLDFSKVDVIREWNEKKSTDKKDSLDILVEINSERNKRLIAIENKVYSKEGKGQTAKYRKLIEENEKYKNYEKMYIYLTLDGEEAEDSDYWATLSYKDIKLILEDILFAGELSEKAKILINDYIDIIEEITMTNKELETICTDIYNKYKEELNIIFDYKFDEAAEMANHLKNIIDELQEDGNIVHYPALDANVTYVRFYTKKLNNLLGEAKNTNNCWANNQRYLFEFHPRELKMGKDLHIVFTLTLNNNEDDLEAKERAERIYNLFSNRKKPAKTSNLKSETILPDAFNYIYNPDPAITATIKESILKYVSGIESDVEKIIKQ